MESGDSRRSLEIRVSAALDRLRSRMWVIPTLLVVGSIVLALVAVWLDRLIDTTTAARLSALLFAGGPDSARLIVSTIAAAMMTFTALVFSVTMLVLQLASSQLSPRVTRTFLRDQVNQVVLGLFVATFVYALMVLREVRSAPAEPFVPAISVSLAFALLLASVVAFVGYINHMTQAIRAVNVLRSVAGETRSAIDRLYPEEIGQEPEQPAPERPSAPPDLVVDAQDGRGIVTSVDVARIVECAVEHRATIALLPYIGDFVPRRAPLFHVWAASRDGGDRDEAIDRLRRELRGAVELGPERTMTQDAAFGFRQLVDVAERALSPGTNDPTTAVQALDEIHDLLRQLARRAIPSPARVADDGTVVLFLPRPDWADYVSLALDEIRQFGAGSIQVARRLRQLLLDLQEVAPASRQAPIARQLRLVDAAIRSAFEQPEDRRAATRPSVTGQGPAETAG